MAHRVLENQILVMHFKYFKYFATQSGLKGKLSMPGKAEWKIEGESPNKTTQHKSLHLLKVWSFLQTLHQDTCQSQLYRL